MGADAEGSGFGAGVDHGSRTCVLAVQEAKRYVARLGQGPVVGDLKWLGRQKHRYRFRLRSMVSAGSNLRSAGSAME
jgi:hypothetical protein